MIVLILKLKAHVVRHCECYIGNDSRGNEKQYFKRENRSRCTLN